MSTAAVTWGGDECRGALLRENLKRGRVVHFQSATEYHPHVTQTSFETPVLIVGAGPAGLATAQQLVARGVSSVIIERGDEPGFVWASLYDSLTLHTGKHLSHLPDFPFRKSDPMFVSRARFAEYLREYADHFDLVVKTGLEALLATRKNGRWIVTTNRGEIRCEHLVVATGIVSNPVIPELDGMDEFHGRISHSADYTEPTPYAGSRVLVVGAGNSGAEIAAELAAAGVDVTIAIRSGANTVPRTLAGVPIQYVGVWLRRLPRFARNGIVAIVRVLIEARRGKSPIPRAPHGPLDAIPLIGFHLEDAVRSGRVTMVRGIERFTPRGARFADGCEAPFDEVILATGYRPAIDFLGNLVSRDQKGFARRSDRVRSAGTDQLWFVGHNYDSSGGLYNIRIDSALVADAISTASRSS